VVSVYKHNISLKHVHYDSFQIKIFFPCCLITIFFVYDNLEYHMILSICRRELFLTKIRSRASIAHVQAREHEMLAAKQNFPLNCWTRERKNRRKGKIDCFFREFCVIELTALVSSSTELNLKLIFKTFFELRIRSLKSIYYTWTKKVNFLIERKK